MIREAGTGSRQARSTQAAGTQQTRSMHAAGTLQEKDPVLCFKGIFFSGSRLRR